MDIDWNLSSNYYLAVASKSKGSTSSLCIYDLRKLSTNYDVNPEELKNKPMFEYFSDSLIGFNNVKWSPHEDGVLAASTCSELQFYDINSEEKLEISRYVQEKYEDRLITELAWDKIDNQIVLSSSNITYDTKNEVQDVNNNDNQIEAYKIHRKGDYGKSKYSLKKTKNLTGLKNSVLEMSFNPNGQILSCLSSNESFVSWSLYKRKDYERPQEIDVTYDKHKQNVPINDWITKIKLNKRRSSNFTNFNKAQKH
jgi:hypothetical protein